MEGPGITEAEEVEPDRLISKAIDGEEGALNELLKLKWLWEVLDGIINRAAQQYEVDANELLSHVLTQINCKITTIRNDNGRSPHECLAGWCRSVIHNRCQSLTRHRSKEVPIDDEQATFELPSTGMSPEEELERQERDAIVEKGTPKAFETVRGVLDSLTSTEFELIRLWVEDLTLKEMSSITRTPLKTVAGRLKRIQRRFFKQLALVGVGEIGEDWAEESGVTQMAEHSTRGERDGLREMIAHCLRDMLGRSPEPPAAFAWRREPRRVARRVFCLPHSIAFGFGGAR